MPGLGFERRVLGLGNDSDQTLKLNVQLQYRAVIYCFINFIVDNITVILVTGTVRLNVKTTVMFSLHL